MIKTRWDAWTTVNIQTLNSTRMSIALLAQQPSGGPHILPLLKAEHIYIHKYITRRRTGPN